MIAETDVRKSSPRKAILALVLVVICGYNWIVMKVALRYSSPFDYLVVLVLHAEPFACEHGGIGNACHPRCGSVGRLDSARAETRSS